MENNMWSVTYYDAVDCREKTATVEGERVEHAIQQLRLSSGVPIGAVVVRAARWLGSLTSSAKVDA